MKLSKSSMGSDHNIGICLIVVSVFLMALQDSLFKFLSSHASLWQVYVFRSLLAVALLAILISRSKHDRRHANSPTFWIVMRSSLLIAMFISLYAAVPFLDMAIIAAGFYISPILTCILAAVVIKERIMARQILGIIIGFIGILMILRPGTDQFKPSMLLPVLAAFCYSSAAIITRLKLIHIHANILSLAANLGLLITGVVVSLIISGFALSAYIEPYSPFLGREWQTLALRDWLIITLLGMLGALIGITLAKAYQIGNPTVIAGFDYCYMIFAVFWGFLLFSEIPTIVTVLGMLLIALAGLMVGLESRKAINLSNRNHETT